MKAYMLSDCPTTEIECRYIKISKDSPAGLATHVVLVADASAEYINKLSNTTTIDNIDLVYVNESTTHTIASVRTSGKAVRTVYSEADTTIPDTTIIKCLFD